MEEEMTRMMIILMTACSCLMSSCGQAPKISRENQALMTAIRRMNLIVDTKDIAGLNLEMTVMSFYNAYRAGYTIHQIIKYSAVNTDSLVVRFDMIMEQHRIIDRIRAEDNTATMFYWIYADIAEELGYIRRIYIE